MTVRDLKNEIENCNNCPLRAKLTELETPWFGVGSGNPKVMLVVDNPKKEQTLLIDGLVLEYLEKNIRAYGLLKNDFYITPYVKCGRKAGKKAEAECSKWISKEISILKPNHTIFLVNGPDIEKETMTSYNTTLYNLTNRTLDDKKYTKKLFERCKAACQIGT